MVLLTIAACSAAGVKYLAAAGPVAGTSPSSPESSDRVPGLAPGPASTKPVKPSSLRRTWMSRPGLPHGAGPTWLRAAPEVVPGPVRAVAGLVGTVAGPAGVVAGAVALPAGT